MSYYQDPSQQYQQGYPPPQSYEQQGYGQQQSHPTQGQQQGYQPTSQPGQQPQAGQGQHAAPEVSDSGNYQDVAYTIKHRNAFSILEVRLRQADVIKPIPGAMVHMSSTVERKGKIKLGLKKFFTGAQMDESTYTGPGIMALTPTIILQISLVCRLREGRAAVACG